MDSNQFCAQESGPDEDHHTVTGFKLSKVVDLDCATYHWNSEILIVQRNSNIIDTFLNDVTTLVTLDGTYGLIWDENLQPSDGKYELGLHYCGTRESDRKSAHGSVAFFRDGVTGVKFAIKTLEENAHFHIEEVKVSLMNRHVNICAVYGIIVRNHSIEILLEHAGLSLNEERAWVAESPHRMLSLAKQSFQALEILHQSGFVHCDIKPDNIMISKSGQDFTVKLIDFGSCQRLGTILPRHAHTTLWYWSPEIWQALNNKKHVVCNFAMDVYALALTLYFVQTSFHLIQLLKEEDIKDLMTDKPEHILLIALPESIPLELRGVMGQCLDGCPEKRLCAEKAVRQLTDDIIISSENYKEKFERLFAILKNSSSSVSAKTVFGENSFQFACDQHNGLQYFVGGRKSVEKREVQNTRNKKHVSFGGTKYNRNLNRSKKLVRQPVKTKPAKRNTSEKSSSLIGPKGPQIEAIDGLDINADERTFSCSILLKNLALQVKPSETQSSDITDSSMLGQSESFADIKTLSLKSSTGVRTTEDVQYIQTQKDAVKPTQIFERGDTFWEYPRQPLMMQTFKAPVKAHFGKAASDVNQLHNFKTGCDQAAVESQAKVYTNVNVTDGIPVATDISMHTPVDGSLATASTRPNIAPDDDVAFVIEAFGPGAFNGSEDDIVNNWLKMIEQDELGDDSGPANESTLNIKLNQQGDGSGPANDSTLNIKLNQQKDGSGLANESNLSIKLNQVRGENLNPCQPREVEFMDTDQTESPLSNQPVSTSNAIVLRAGSKRMSYSMETVEIPNKTICPHPEQKLPNFDQILS